MLGVFQNQLGCYNWVKMAQQISKKVFGDERLQSLESLFKSQYLISHANKKVKKAMESLTSLSPQAREDLCVCVCVCTHA